MQRRVTVARPVPLAALGRGLGLDGERLVQAVVDAIAVGPSYLSGTGDAGVDAAVERLRALLDRGSPDRTAAAIAVLAQAGEATAALVGNALALAAEEPALRPDVEGLLLATLRRLP